MTRLPIILLLPFVFAAPVQAGWELIPPTELAVIARSGLAVSPKSEWNSASARPSPRGESWTKDGFALNRLDLFAEIAPGEPIYKERNRKLKPLPKFASGMLAPDLVELFTANFSIVNDVTLFTIELSEPASLGGRPATRIVYSYALPGDALRRQGEARLAIVGDKLTVINFSAPALHYFEASIGEVRAMMDDAKILQP